MMEYISRLPRLFLGFSEESRYDLECGYARRGLLAHVGEACPIDLEMLGALRNTLCVT